MRRAVHHQVIMKGKQISTELLHILLALHHEGADGEVPSGTGVRDVASEVEVAALVGKEVLHRHLDYSPSASLNGAGAVIPHGSPPCQNAPDLTHHLRHVRKLLGPLRACGTAAGIFGHSAVKVT